jgi:hypothetical protein
MNGHKRYRQFTIDDMSMVHLRKENLSQGSLKQGECEDD